MNHYLDVNPTNIVFNYLALNKCDGCGEETQFLQQRICGHKMCGKCNQQRECQVCLDLFAWYSFIKDANVKTYSN